MPKPAPNADLPTTQWSLISRLRGNDPADARAALDELCQAYHYPLYCQIRRRGLSHHDAEDALHEFFIKLLRLDTLGIADSDKGRLRTFLIVALRRYLSNWQRDQHSQQGREISRESLAALAHAEDRYAHDEAAHHESPDRLYDLQWAEELMNRVLHNLHQTYTEKGRAGVFTTLRPVLLTGGSLVGHDSAALAAKISLTPGALRTALHRLLEDYREALRHEVLFTVDNSETGKLEYEELMAVFRPR